jgi:hypothetical protein
MAEDRKQQQRASSDKTAEENEVGSALDLARKSGVPRKANAPGRPGNITSDRPTVAGQKSKSGSRGGPTSKAGR